MRRINVVKGSDVPVVLNFTASNGIAIDLSNYNDPDDFFIIKLFYKSGEILATYDSRPSGGVGIVIPDNQTLWATGRVDIYMESEVTSAAKEGDIYYQLRRRMRDSVPSDGWIDTYSPEIYLFTIVRAI
jgi:hypothetical protein